MRSENHPRPDTPINAGRHSHVRKREDGVIEITVRRSLSGIGGRPRNADAPSQPPHAPGSWWRSIASAMLSAPERIFEAFVEGFALYAVHMNPGLFWFSGENIERADPADDAAPVPPLTACVDPSEWLRSVRKPLPIQNNSIPKNR